MAALALATSGILWSQAVIAEVYTLQLFFASAITLCLLKWRQDPGRTQWLWLAGLLGGVGLGSHMTLALVLLPAAALVAWIAISHHNPWRTVLGGGLSFLLGLLVFLYLPWRAAQASPINWGSANTWSGFWWLVSAAPYRHLAFGLPWEHLPQRVSALANLVGSQFQWWGLFLGLLGLFYLWQKDRPWALFSGAIALLTTVYAITYDTTDSYVYLLPLALVLSWWLAVGIAQVMHWIARRPGAQAAGLSALALGLLVLVPGVNVARSYGAQDLSRSREAEVYARNVWQATEPDAIIMSDRDAQLFALWYFDVIEAPRTGS